MGTANRGKLIGVRLGQAILIFLGWCVVMFAYGLFDGALETDAVPVGISPFKDVSVMGWNYGTFNAKGSFQNELAENSDDELALGTSDISCVKSHNTCTITTADIFSKFVNLDITNYDIDTWDDKAITFKDSNSICADWTYRIDRAAQTVSGARRTKAVIPDYAKKSPLHPCDHLKDLNVSLVRGSVVHDQKLKDFRDANGFKLHMLLAVLNLAYFGLIFWWFRRHRSEPNLS